MKCAGWRASGAPPSGGRRSQRDQSDEGRPRAEGPEVAGQLNAKWAAVKEAPFWMTAATVLLALLCLGIGILFSSTVTTWIQPAADVLAEGVHAVVGSWGL